MSDVVDMLNRRQFVCANVIGSTGQRSDLARGAGLDARAKTAFDLAGVLALAEGGVKVTTANPNDAARSAGVAPGMTGVPALDEPASPHNQAKNLESLILKLKLEFDMKQENVRERSIEQTKTARELKQEQMLAKTRQSLNDMADAAQSQDKLKAFSWAMFALSAVMTVATCGAGVGATAVIKAVTMLCISTAFQVMNETEATADIAKSISDAFGDKTGVSGQAVVGLIQLAVMLGGGYMNMSAGASATKAVLPRIQQLVAGVMSGMGVAQAGLGVRNAFEQYDAQMSQTETTEMRAQLDLLNQILEEQQEELQALIDQIVDSFSSFFEVVDSQNRAQQKIAEEMGQMA